MGNREEAAKALREALDKQMSLRHDEKAWKKQHKNVEKAGDAYRETFTRGK